jgi:hypothetical protein
MRKFKHLAQLSDDELRVCMRYVEELLTKLQAALQAQADQEELDKELHSELRHQLRVYDQLQQHAAMRRYNVKQFA